MFEERFYGKLWSAKQKSFKTCRFSCAHFSALISTKIKNAKDVYKIYFVLKVNLLGEAKFEAVYIVDERYYKKIKSLEEFDELQQ